VTETLEKIPPPWWLLLIFGAEGLGWLAQGALEIFLTLAASAFPERVLAILYLSLQIAVAFAAAAVFVVGVVRPIEDSAAARFAQVHCVAGTLVTVPFFVLSIAHAIDHLGDRAWSDTAATLATAFVLIVIPIGGIVASRRDKPALVIIAAVIGVLWVFGGALFVFGAGFGVAGITA